MTYGPIDHQADLLPAKKNVYMAQSCTICLLRSRRCHRTHFRATSRIRISGSDAWLECDMQSKKRCFRLRIQQITDEISGLEIYSLQMLAGAFSPDDI